LIRKTGILAIKVVFFTGHVSKISYFWIVFGVVILLHCPGAGPWPSGPRADPGPALKGQGKGHT